jgi:hypothetical protein
MRRSVQDIFIRGGCASGLSCVVPRARRERRRKWLKGDGPAAGPSLRRRRARPTPPSWAARRRRPARRPERGSREPPARAGGVQPCPVSTGGWTRRVRLVRGMDAACQVSTGGWTRRVRSARRDEAAGAGPGEQGKRRAAGDQHGGRVVERRGRRARGAPERRVERRHGCRHLPRPPHRQPSAVSRQPSAVSSARRPAAGRPSRFGTGDVLAGAGGGGGRAGCWGVIVV